MGKNVHSSLTFAPTDEEVRVLDVPGLASPTKASSVQKTNSKFLPSNFQPSGGLRSLLQSKRLLPIPVSMMCPGVAHLRRLNLLLRSHPPLLMLLARLSILVPCFHNGTYFLPASGRKIRRR